MVIITVMHYTSKKQKKKRKDGNKKKMLKCIYVNLSLCCSCVRSVYIQVNSTVALLINSSFQSWFESLCSPAEVLVEVSSEIDRNYEKVLFCTR